MLPPPHRAMPAAGTAAPTRQPLREPAMTIANTALSGAEDTTVLRKTYLLVQTR